VTHLFIYHDGNLYANGQVLLLLYLALILLVWSKWGDR
jgi:hypothetical protein